MTVTGNLSMKLSVIYDLLMITEVGQQRSRMVRLIIITAGRFLAIQIQLVI